MINLDQYMQENNNLPDFMKDFHDQKDLFKTIYDQYAEGNNKGLLSNINWVDAHCFTVDVFLWWMGRHGYKLQKSRSKNIKFNDPEETIKYFTDLRRGKQIKNISDMIKKS